MKKIILILSVASLVWVMSCKDDDDAGSFVGTWIGQTVSITGCDDPTRNSPPSNLRCDDAFCYRLDLEGNGDFTYREGLSTRTGFWDLNGSLKLCTDEEGETVCEKFDAQIAQGNLFLTADSTSAGCVYQYIFFREEPADTTSTDE